MTIIDRVRSGWTALKILRVSLGGLILYSSTEEGNIPGMAIGGLLIIFSLVTEGTCCIAGQGCASVKKDTGAAIENADYEELGK